MSLRRFLSIRAEPDQVANAAFFIVAAVEEAASA